MKLLEYISDDEKILVYGAGYVANMFYNFLKESGMEQCLEKFVVNNEAENPTELKGKKVSDYRNYIKDDKKIVIALGSGKQKEVYQELVKAGIDKSRILSLGEQDIEAVKQIGFNSAEYWEWRYEHGGNSGSGSYNRLANFKADVINRFVKEHDIQDVVEWGCGDGNQLKLAEYPRYTGIDVSEEAVKICRQIFESDTAKTFVWSGNDSFENSITGELALSLDVIYHLVEDNIFEEYMSNLFASAKRYVCIYASDFEERSTLHVRHRKFTRWIEERLQEEWELFQVVKNKYPFSADDADNTSNADFYFYSRRKLC